MSNDIFSSDYKLEGTDKESFLVNWKNFRSKTKIIKDFDLSKMKIYHINKNISDKLRLLSMDNFINSLEALTFDGNSELKSDNSYYSISANIPDEIKKRIADGNITTAVSVGNKILFLDENCRSMIATKCKASFRKLYEHTIASDILLQLACKEFIPAGKLKTKYPVAIVRADKGVAVLTAFFSESTAVTNLAEIDEMNSPLLKFVNYSISNYATELIFEAEALDEFVPIIKVRFSDTGDGLLKKFLCVRTKTTKRSVIIKELDNVAKQMPDDILMRFYEKSQKKLRIEAEKNDCLQTIESLLRQMKNYKSKLEYKSKMDAIVSVLDTAITDIETLRLDIK